MESSQVYHIKQQFTLGAYHALTSASLPDPSSPDYIPTLLYKARAYIALGETPNFIPEDNEHLALRAVTALANGEGGLETLRDLCVEIEGAEDEGGEWEREMVRVLAATAFVRAGEIEEALETLSGAGRDASEAAALTAQIYLSLARPSLAQKTLDAALKENPDSLVLQLAEAALSLVTGSQGISGEPYTPAVSFYSEQVANPSVSSPALLMGRGIARIMQGEIAAGRSDLDEASAMLERSGTDKSSSAGEVIAALVVAVGLGAGKKTDADEAWTRLTTDHPSHPLVVDINAKADLFDECAAKFDIPPTVGVQA
ncbi:coatomer epsilon subunit-domain-containing protein [Hygrophoropsis aurantiaca]|uniref:Coatomer epsilon subunit-domain-containing protein n=1 Tax=Hygrophoropsis aurantiaca TaxID=72124 RepID=A0ACB8AQ48_9AGAM|nr:coatomer epsilon subunit-domain-containing protein [Hygrophoropsis aurantiaca]